MEKGMLYKNEIKNERGVALVLALIMLVLMSILGAFALSTTNTEMRIVGNYHKTNEAFFCADAGIEYGQTNGTTYTSIIPNVTNSWSSGFLNCAAGGTDTIQITVNWIASGQPPVGSGVDAETTVNYYTVASTGQSRNNAQVVVESYIARLQRMSD
jgi:Tfp pilus assembly protein PilX